MLANWEWSETSTGTFRRRLGYAFASSLDRLGWTGPIGRDTCAVLPRPWQRRHGYPLRRDHLQRLLLGQGAVLALHGTLFFQSIVVSTMAIGLSSFPNT